MDYWDGIYPIYKNILIFEISECLATILRAQHPIYHRQLATHVIYYFKYIFTFCVFHTTVF